MLKEKIKVGMKVIFHEDYIDGCIWHEGIVTEILGYNPEIGIQHYMIKGYKFPVPCTAITEIMEG